MSEFTSLPPWADFEASRLLPNLCAQREGQHVEFKERLPPQGHDIGKSIAAFASSGPGVLLYGVSNDGRIVGVENGLEARVRDQVAQRVSSAAKEVRPPVHPTVLWAYQNGAAVCFVRVERGFEAIYYSNQRPIVRRGPTSRPAEPSEVEQAFRERYSGNNQTAALPSTREIAERLSKVLLAMNKDRTDAVTVADLALAMGLSAPADLDSIMVGQAPATFDLLDRFCARFAVNKEWLSTGRCTPFYSEVEHRSFPEQYLQVIEEACCEAVYVVRSKSDIGETFIVVESDRLKFWLLPDIWHVSDHVGGAGARDLVSLCSLFETWARSNRQYSVLGRQLEPALAQAIWNGECFPGVVVDMPLSHWWDDLIDLEHKWTSRKGLLKTYGKQFVAAQDIIRELRAKP